MRVLLRQNFHFAGCSGARLVHMVADNGQIKKTGSPSVIVMTVGGNNAGFGTLVDNCIYHGVPGGEYGAPFHDDPDGTGECTKSLAAAEKYINDPEIGGWANDFSQTLDDIFMTDQARSHDQFWLYVTGYVPFFNNATDGELAV